MGTTEENNTGAKVIGVLSLVVATWGVYNLFFKKEEKKLSGLDKAKSNYKLKSQLTRLNKREQKKVNELLKTYSLAEVAEMIRK